jgi:hypothetical protein
MPGEMIDNDTSDFDTALQDLEFVSQKAQLIHEIEVKTRSLPVASKLQKIKIQQEVLILKEKIKDLEKLHFDSKDITLPKI